MNKRTVAGEKPLYQDKALIKVMRDLIPDIKLKESDFRNPSQQIVMDIYAAFIAYMELNNANVFDSPEYHSLKYPEMHTKAIELAVTARVLSYIFNLIGSKIEFKLSDLITPNAQRTRVFFGDFANFLLVAQNSVENLSSGVDMMKNAETRIKEMAKQRDAFKNKTCLELAEDGKREAKVKDFDKRMSSAENNLKMLGVEIASMQATGSELERESSELSERANLRLQDKETKLSKLKQIENQLVTSPERVRRETDHLRSAMHDIKTQCSDREATLSDRKKLRDVIRKMSTSAMEIKDMSQQVVHLEKTKKTLDFEINSVRAEHKQVASNIQTRENELCKLNSEVKSTNEKLSSATRNNTVKLEKMKELLKSYEVEKDRLDDLLDGTMQRMREHQYELDELAHDKILMADYANSIKELEKQILAEEVEIYKEEMTSFVSDFMK